MITPNCHLVKRMASAQFHYIMDILDREPTVASIQEFQTRGRFYYDRALKRKQLEIENPDDAMDFEDYGLWSEDDENAFFLRRYGLMPEDFLSEWRGGLGAMASEFLDAVVVRDFGCDDFCDLVRYQAQKP